MKHRCEKCNYETNDKSNYNKHMRSSAHIHVNPGNTQKLTIRVNKVPGKFQCPKCDKIFTSAPGLSRHKNKVCKMDKIKEQVREELKQEFELELIKKELEYKDKIIERIEKDNIELKQYIKTVKPTTYNISVKKMIQQSYPDAPHLEKLDNYSIIHEDDDSFTNDIIYYHNNNKLEHYLGDIIIKYYKKEDPRDQSLWSTDSSRLKYIIKELLASNNSHWSEDDKGLKIKKSIIDPLLKYIRDYVNDKIDELHEEIEISVGYECIDIGQKQLSLGKIREQINNGTLKDSIVKYIAHAFRFNSDKLTVLQVKNE